MKKLIKSFIVILLAIILLAPTVMGFEIQMWSEPGRFVTVNNNHSGLFCVNHGFRFITGTYRVYESGFIKDLPLKRGHNGDGGLLLSFIIGDMQRAIKYNETDRSGNRINGVTTRNPQEWQQYIWELLGDNSQSPSLARYEDLKAKYQEYKKVYELKDEDIKINFESDVAVANTNNMIGPFKIDYKYNDKIDEYIDLTITMTNNSTGENKELFKKEYKNITTNIITSDAERYNSI